MSRRGDISAYRVMVEGLGIEFVTSPGMEKTTGDGRLRLESFVRAGCVLADETTVIDQTLEAQGMTFNLVETADNDLAKWLATKPDSAWLGDDVAVADSAITVESTSGMSTGTILHAGTEAMYVSSVGGTVGVTRGYWDSIAQDHEFTLAANDCRVYLDYPPTIEGRRVYLFKYGIGDDLSGDGEQVWIGEVKGVDYGGGGAWAIRADSIQKRWTQDIASQSEIELTPRGIYYPLSGYRLRLHLLDGHDWDDDVSDTSDIISLEGHFETQRDFLDALNAAIATEIAAQGWTEGRLEGIEDVYGDPTRWYFRFTALTSGPAQWIRPEHEGPAERMEGRCVPESSRISAAPNTTWGIRLVSNWGGAAQVPRAWYGIPFSWATPSNIQNLGPNTIYVSESLGSLTSGTLEIDFVDDDDDTPSVSGVNVEASDGYLYGGPRHRSGRPYNADSVHLRLRRNYAQGSYYDFLADLVASSPSRTNRGDGPFITAADVDTSQTVLEEAASRHPMLHTRSYDSIKAAGMDELEAAELALLGVVPAVASDGRRRYVKWRIPSTTEVTDLLLDSTVIVEPIRWSRSPYGILGSVTLKRGYSGIEDDYRLPDITAIDAFARSITKADKDRLIEPLSYSAEEEDISADELYAITEPWLGSLGRPLHRVEVGAHISAVDANGNALLTTALVGSTVKLSNARVPRPGAGAYGVTTVPGIIVSRQWDLETGEGRLGVVISDEAIVGYAPDLVLSSASGSGVDYVLTVLTTDPLGITESFPDGAVLSDFYRAGDYIDVLEWDNASPTIQRALVNSVSDSPKQLDVTFDSTATLTGTRYIRFAGAGDATANMDDFAYWGGTDRRVNFSTDLPAKVFGP